MSNYNSNNAQEFFEDDFLEEYEEQAPSRFRRRRSSTPSIGQAVDGNGRRVNPYAKKGSSEKKTRSRRMRTRSTRKPADWGLIWARVHFFFCASLILGGCLLVIFQYMQVFDSNNEIERMRARLESAQSDNALLAAAASGETMNMDTLYNYAVGTLGMVEAGPEDIIKITVLNQSYTTSALPSQDISESKVSYHWFKR